MDCRTFRKKHVAFVDDLLPGVELVEMQRHLIECRECAEHDATIRRALLLFRNLTPIEPSADFTERLNARLRAEREREAQAPRMPMVRGPSRGAFAGIAASLVTIGYLTASSLDWNAPKGDITLAPVVASQPATPAPSAASQALVTSVSAGMPVWPVMYLADQAPLRFVQVEFTQASWGR